MVSDLTHLARRFSVQFRVSRFWLTANGAHLRLLVFALPYYGRDHPGIEPTSIQQTIMERKKEGREEEERKREKKPKAKQTNTERSPN